MQIRSCRFVVLEGLPGSGKTRLARRLAPVLGLPVIDKDDVLERLFAPKGVGDATWRRQLSREADRLLQAAAMQSTGGAILVSMWHRDGMPSDSGTPCDWLNGLSGLVMTVLCVCDAQLAARRFADRARHEGHLDKLRTGDDIVASIEHVARLPSNAIGEVVRLDTTVDPPLGQVADAIAAAFARATAG